MPKLDERSVLIIRFHARRFTDKQVLQPDYKDELAGVVRIVRPFVHWYVAGLRLGCLR